MLQVKYYLRKDKISKDGQMPLILSIYFNGNRLKKTVRNFKCKESEWNIKTSRFRKTILSNGMDGEVLNGVLDIIEANLRIVKNDAIIKGKSQLDAEYLVKIINSPFIINNKQRSFQSIIDEFIIEQMPSKAKNTVKGYNTLKKFIEGFEVEYKQQLLITSFNDNFFKKFSEYSTEKRKTKHNYYSKLISTLGVVLNWAVEKEYLPSNSLPKLKVSYDDIEVIFLTEGELKLLLNHDFKSDRLNSVRDVFCFGCFTGLRFSDISSLSAASIKETYIEKRIQKTRKEIIKIPLLDSASLILNKYKDTRHNVLPKFSNVELNRTIKECCKIVGIDSETEITYYIGSKMLSRKGPKYEFITSHTARKTFATLSFMFGMDAKMVQKNLGHKKEENLRKYLEIQQAQSDQKTNEAWSNLRVSPNESETTK